MKDKAGNRLKESFKLDFSDEQQRLRESVNRKDIDIYRFRAEAGSIDITTQGLGKKAKIRLYETKRSPRKTLKKIGQSEFMGLPLGDRKKFLERVPFPAAGEGKSRTYSTKVDLSNYFLVVSAPSKKTQKYRLQFVSNPEIDLGIVKSGRVGATDTEDTFSFNLDNRQKVSFTLDGLNGTADLNLLDSNRTLLKTIKATDSSAISMLRNLPSGTYYIQVSSTSDAETSYNLTTSQTPPDKRLLHSVNGRNRPGEQGELYYNQGTFKPDDVDRISNNLNVNGSKLPTDRREDLRSHLNTNYTGEVAQESVGSNGTTLKAQPGNTRHSGYVGYSNHSPDYDNVSATVSNSEAEAWYTTKTPPSTLQYKADIKPVNNTKPTVLDASIGYTVSFDVAVQADERNIKKPGFTMIAVSSDGSSAIELAFTSTTILGHDPNFVPVERVSPTEFNMGDMNRYDLYVVEKPEGITYELFANGNSILSGPTRNYIFDTASVKPPLPFNQYKTPNYLFFGTKGNTTTATFTLGAVSTFT